MWHHDRWLHLHVDNKGRSLCCVEARCDIMTVACTCMSTTKYGIDRLCATALLEGLLLGLVCFHCLAT